MTDFNARRTMMVDTQIRPSDVTKFPVIDAMLDIAREDFVPTDAREAAYVGENVPLGPRSRVVLDPRVLAKMLDGLDIQPTELVLDIGSGLGYSTAVIARMAQVAVALEEDESLCADGQAALSACGADNVVTQCAPLAEGAPEHGPYDVIVLQGAAVHVPDTILAQLKEGGRIGAIMMEGNLGVARIGYKIDSEISWRFAFNATAPVLPGFDKEPAFAL
ncbi:protein-L-isoaspartate O-methyltransferase [Litorivita sp. NS0012-18]|uniref:protein-L-isoaspartate O-methyltransferase family protein n=1 Tax=Litorivita sp. NS0012-18 TaxID=3127655 RepID=UPI003106764F